MATMGEESLLWGCGQWQAAHTSLYGPTSVLTWAALNELKKEEEEVVIFGKTVGVA